MFINKFYGDGFSSAATGANTCRGTSGHVKSWNVEQARAIRPLNTPLQGKARTAALVGPTASSGESLVSCLRCEDYSLTMRGNQEPLTQRNSRHDRDRRGV